MPPPQRAGGGSARSARRAGHVPFTVFDAGMALLLFFVGQLIVGVGAGIALAVGAVTRSGSIDAVGAFSSETLLAVAIVSALVGTAMAIGWLAVRQRLDRRLFGRGRHGALKIVIGVAAGFVATVATYTVNAMLVLVFRPEAPVVQQVLQDALGGGRSLVLAAIVIVLLAPVTEEIVFRGILFQSLDRRLGFWFAATVSSVVFCAIHVEVIMSQPLALVGMFVLSMILAASFHLSGSLIVPIMVHAVFNATSLGLALAFDRFEDMLEMWDMLAHLVVRL
ncbi:MAG: CPBP family intramembrane glutamic endopeptidase [Nitriliruptoraceae bacterium]